MNPEIKYEIGQNVWWARYNNMPVKVTCPDCGGEGRLHVTFYDGTTVSIDCQNCAVGYEPPSGEITVYKYVDDTKLVRVTGFAVNEKNQVEYRTNISYIVDAERLFDEIEDARNYVKTVLVPEAEREQQKKINLKEKDTRSWAWNASYHRSEIKRMKELIVYHERKLNVANLKAKK